MEATEFAVTHTDTSQLLSAHRLRGKRSTIVALLYEGDQSEPSTAISTMNAPLSGDHNECSTFKLVVLANGCSYTRPQVRLLRDSQLLQIRLEERLEGLSSVTVVVFTVP